MRGNGTYKLIEWADGRRELYNLNADPREYKNLLGGTLTVREGNNLRDLQARLDALLPSR